jgi:renierapurpurin 18,18'-hydroxylase
VRYKGKLSKFLGLSTQSDGVTTRIVSIDYQYPHYHSTLEGVSSLHLMRLPVGLNETRSFSLLFLQIRLPKWLLKPFKTLIAPVIRHFLFMPFLEQDVGMMESEQHNYEVNPQRRYVEVNPAIIALQRLIVRQFVQQSSPSASPSASLSEEFDPHRPSENASNVAEATIEQTPENSMR